MTEQRWTEGTVELVAAAIVDHAWITESDSDRIAELALAALAEAGLLLPPGGVTETQPAVRWPSGWVQRFADRAKAEAAVKERHEWADGDPAYGDGVVVERTVIRWREGRKTTALYSGPWREVTL